MVDRSYFRVGFDDETMARLVEMAEACHCPIEVLVAGIVASVLEDDSLAHHGPIHAGEDRRFIN